ncbi:hypothetical protein METBISCDRAFT_26195 [Metschnikowia bicuspidata]|uniref:Uncharacterized protein n=1 Tax=Metschnikowia bicuspidata TaxID=27322 RepID=A0A4P9ZHF8_9ASCO|nr:hypothetical protein METBISCDRAFT_26195 [Metschnikowia bicuspidata]
MCRTTKYYSALYRITPASTNTMAVTRSRTQTQGISWSRAAKASLLTLLTVLFFFVACFHVCWAIKAFYHDRYGSALYNVVIIVGGLVLNATVSIYFLVFLETCLLSDGIDADHKKYI